MRIDILTIFPEALRPYTETSMLKKAQDDGVARVKVHDLRKWASDRHATVDDRPFGGGPGMVLKVAPIYRAVQDLSKEDSTVILTSARGERFSQSVAREWSLKSHLIIIAGHYEGVDERVHQYIVDKKVSIGNYILTGGELPALVVTDAVTRLVPGVLGEPASLKNDLREEASVSAVSYPVYTRPEHFEVDSGETWEVPKVLLSGNHAEVERWRKNYLTKIDE